MFVNLLINVLFYMAVFCVFIVLVFCDLGSGEQMFYSLPVCDIILLYFSHVKKVTL